MAHVANFHLYTKGNNITHVQLLADTSSYGVLRPATMTKMDYGENVDERVVLIRCLHC